MNPFSIDNLMHAPPPAPEADPRPKRRPSERKIIKFLYQQPMYKALAFETVFQRWCERHGRDFSTAELGNILGDYAIVKRRRKHGHLEPATITIFRLERDPLLKRRRK